MTLRPAFQEEVPTGRMETRYVKIPVFCANSGYTEKAVRRKIEEGVWIEGRHYRRAPDGHVLMDLVGYKEWVEAGAAAA